MLLLSSLASVGASYMLKPAINDYVLPGDFRGLARILCLMGALYLLNAVMSYGYSRIMVRISQKTVAQLRQDLFNKMQTLPLRYYDTHQSGDLMSRFTNDIETVSEMLNSTFTSVLSNALTFAATIAAMLWLNWVLTLITFGFLLLMLLMVKLIVPHIVQELFHGAPGVLGAAEAVGIGAVTAAGTISFSHFPAPPPAENGRPRGISRWSPAAFYGRPWPRCGHRPAPR